MMHPILKAQLSEATRGEGTTSTLDIGRLIELVGAFYESLDGGSLPLDDVLAASTLVLDRSEAVAVTPNPAPPALSPTDTTMAVSMASNSGIRARFSGIHLDDLRTVLDSIADMVLTVDNEGLIQFSNRVAVKFFAPDQRSLAGRALSEFLPMSQGSDVGAFLDPYVAELDRTNPDLIGGEISGCHIDGRAYRIELTASRMSALGAGEYVICMRDVSARAAAAAALRENEERYRALVEHAPEAILVFDAGSNQFIDANDHASTLFNLPRKRLLASGFFGLRDVSKGVETSAEQKRIETFLQRALQGGQPTFEWIYHSRGGVELPCEVRLSRMPAEDRDLVRVSVNSIAGRKRRELVDYSEKKLLEMIASGVSFKKVMRALCRTAERVVGNCRASIMLVDVNRSDLLLHSAPAFGDADLKAIRRLPLDEPRLSCGVAIATGKPVITPDVFAHRAWSDHHFLARRLGFVSAWSFPVTGVDTGAAATIDVYFEEKREPTTDELDWLGSLSRLAGIAIGRERNRAALSQSEGRFRGLFENVVEGVYIASTEGRIISANPALVAMLGYADEDDLIENARRKTAYANKQDAQFFEREIDEHGEVRGFEAIMLRRDGTPIEVIENARAVDYANGERCIEGTISDITERKQAERRIFAEKERAEVTLKSIGDGVITTDAEGRIEYLNPVAEDLTGWSLRAVRGEPVEDLLTLINEHSREMVDNPITRCLNEGRVITMSGPTLLIDRSGQEIAIQNSTAPIRDRKGHTVGSVMVFHDVSAEGRLSRKLSYQATHDALTGFINRQEFENVLERAIARRRTNPTHQYALLYIDIDQFKIVNDTFGHTAGDELIRQISACLQTSIHINDTVARLGGDEFGLLLSNCDADRATDIAEVIRATVEGYRFEWQHSVQAVTASIGIVMLDRDNATVGALLSAADVACFAAKDMGRNRYHLYREGDAGVRHQEMHWLNRINRALEESRFELYFQSIALTVAPEDGPDCTHYELLLRMIDEDGNVIPPGTFIAAAERYDRMQALDRWVVAEALAHADQGDPEQQAAYTLSINLSGNSLSDDRFLEYIKDLLAETPLCKGGVCFEITETAAIANLNRVRHFMSELKKLGCLFSLDDFGSGLSSFAYLKNLPVDFLKVDGAFIKNVARDDVDQSMVAAIQQVAQAMGIRAVAEHVEDEATRVRLAEIGVPLVQGFHIARPAPVRRFSPWSAEASRRA